MHTFFNDCEYPDYLDIIKTRVANVKGVKTGIARESVMANSCFREVQRFKILDFVKIRRLKFLIS